MKILTEEEVYNGAKRWLRSNGYIVLAGQPARGVDHLPVIEIKMPTGNKGSNSSYKPDFVAFKNGMFYIVECKPEYNEGDRQKILDILNSKERLSNFYEELSQYQLLTRAGFVGNIEDFYNSVRGILAFSGEHAPVCEMEQLVVEDWKGKATMI